MNKTNDINSNTVKAIDKIFENAEKENRYQLLEHEAYTILSYFGIKTPTWKFIETDKNVNSLDFNIFKSEKLVVKVVSPDILHKTDVEGIKIIANDDVYIQNAINDMKANIANNYLKWCKDENKFPDHLKNKNDNEIINNINNSIKGFLLVEFIEYQKNDFFSEMMIGIRQTREFGPIVSSGIGGVGVEFYNEIMKTGKASKIYSACLDYNEDYIDKSLNDLVVVKSLSGEIRGSKKLIDNKNIISQIKAFINLAKTFSDNAINGNNDYKSKYIIDEFEVNPFVVINGEMLALDGLCKFKKADKISTSKPINKVKNMLKPQSIGIVGVSEKMNVGHIILNNIIEFGFNKERVYVVKPDTDSIEGVKCYNDIESIPEKLDLFIITIPASQTIEIMNDINKFDKAHSIILISGGFGEKEDSGDLAKQLHDIIDSSRNNPDKGFVLNGANCLGIYSGPGKYNTIFIPEYKLPTSPSKESPLAYVSQSGAFMITRLNNLFYIKPRYSISTGNQDDLTVSDILSYIKDDDDTKVYGVYIEGFKDLDGIFCAKLCKEINCMGKEIIIYKAGRSSEGKSAASGHTASIAGDYEVFEEILSATGSHVCKNFIEFESMIKLSASLLNKKVNGNRVGIISNAGFECVGMADNLSTHNNKLKLANFSDKTKSVIHEAFVTGKLDKIVDIKNPLDLTPMANDEVYERSVMAMVDSDEVDVIVASCVPLTPMCNTLYSSGKHKEDITHIDSLGNRFIRCFKKSNKPIIFIIDSGNIYNPLAEMMEKEGLPVFRLSDIGISALRDYVAYKLRK